MANGVIIKGKESALTGFFQGCDQFLLLWALWNLDSDISERDSLEVDLAADHIGSINQSLKREVPHHRVVNDKRSRKLTQGKNNPSLMKINELTNQFSNNY